MPEPLRAVSFNVWVGQSPTALRNNLIGLADDLDNPHVLALQEAKRYHGTIPGYRRVAATGHAEAASTILLVRRRGVTITREKPIVVDGPQWIGPKHGDIHEPRIFPTITAEIDGQRWDLAGIHRTPGGPGSRNAASWAAEDAALQSWLDNRQDRHPHRATVLLGDWNNRKADPHPLAVAGLARRTGCTVRLRGIDGALVRDVVRVKVRKLSSKYGSDAHRPVTITAHASATARRTP